MPLDMPTPESLEAEANDLEMRADAKERQSKLSWSSRAGAANMERDAAIFREEAKAKRAKAERMRKASQQ